MDKSKSVPTSRVSRLAAIGSFASKVAGNIVVEGTKSVFQGKKPSINTLLLTPRNFEHLANQLMEMRGAAMKLGQLLSMDAGELLSPELSAVLNKLQSQALPMPHKQLVTVMKANWGERWLDRLSYFDLRPFAAASIGQVHQAYTECGDKLAIKVQYPGISRSIESDVDNVVSLLRISKLIPKELDLTPLIEEAKKQLIAEADYQLEAEHLFHYRTLVCNFDEFVVPKFYDEHSTKHVLAMEYIEAENLLDASGLTQEKRNKIAQQLIRLFFAELFLFNLVQTDPNLANFKYNTKTEKVVLLDFGATRTIPEHVSHGYHKLLEAALKFNESSMVRAATEIGYLKGDSTRTYQDNLIDIFKLALEPLSVDKAYDFGQSSLANQLKNRAISLSQEPESWQPPPIDAIFIHRKVAGLYLIASKLGAKVNVRDLFVEFNRQFLG